MKTQREIRSLTGLRGLAACYVLLLHYFSGLAYSNPLNVFLSHGYIAVDLFFILSGFVMALNYAHLFEQGISRKAFQIFLSRRIARVYPLYFCGTLAGASFIAIADWRTHQFQLGSFLVYLGENIAMIQTWGLGPSLDPPGWSISAEWAAYLVFPLLLWAAYLKKSVWFAWGTAVAAISVLAILCALPESVIHRPDPRALLFMWQYQHGLAVWRCLPEFSLGILTARFYTSGVLNRALFNCWAALGVAATILILLCIPATDLVVVLLFPILMLQAIPANNPLDRVLASTPVHRLGVLSYSIYIIHDLLGGFMNWLHAYVQRHGLAHAQTYAAAAAVTVTFLLAPLAYRFIESPGRVFLRNLLEGEPAARTAPAKDTQAQLNLASVETSRTGVE